MEAETSPADAARGTEEARPTADDAPARAHAMGLPDETRLDLGRRLARVRGQVDGIARMVEDDRYCIDILHQFAAVHSALRSAEKRLLEAHLERCATRAIAEGGTAAREARAEIVDLFHRFLK